MTPSVSAFGYTAVCHKCKTRVTTISADVSEGRSWLIPCGHECVVDLVPKDNDA